MQQLLIEFINTLDLSLKSLQEKVGSRSGFARLTIHQFQYIDAIHELGEPSITELAARLNITKASVTAGVNKLISMGYVNKTQSSADRRVYHASLTAAGQHLVAAKYQALREYGDFIDAALSEEEARQFQDILAKLVRLFKQA
ncbi:MAG TPA: MarR family transcriptional regulator [Anaerolineae bacterium]|nr:MarR family transcriptional regulator [Anaerolineae bacterium]